MRRWCLSKIMEVNPSDPYWSHKMLEAYSLQEFTRYAIKTDPVTGVPTEKAILLLVESADFTEIAADPDIVLMPDVGLSTSIGHGLTTVEKELTKAKIVSLGFTEQQVGDAWLPSKPYGELLNDYGRLNADDFNVLNFTL
jgi:hypothetical protein